MTYLILFLEFFKIGLFSVGGGLATLPFLYELCDKYDWFDASQLADMIAISESTPGPIGINMSTYAGFHAGGVLGAIVATMGLVMPSLIVIIIIAGFLEKFSENRFVKSSFTVVKPTVTALIAVAVFQIYKISIINIDAFLQSKFFLDLFRWKEIILFAIILFFVMKFKKHPIVYIAGGVLCGIVLKL